MLQPGLARAQPHTDVPPVPRALRPAGTLMVPVVVLEELIKQRLRSIIGVHVNRNTVGASC
jgi:hypothetical protein